MESFSRESKNYLRQILQHFWAMSRRPHRTIQSFHTQRHAKIKRSRWQRHPYWFSGLRLRTALPARQISMFLISSISFSKACL